MDRQRKNNRLQRLCSFVYGKTNDVKLRRTSKLRIEELEARQMLAVGVASSEGELVSSTESYCVSSTCYSTSFEAIDVSSVDSDPDFDEIYSEISSIELEEDREQELLQNFSFVTLNGQTLQRLDFSSSNVNDDSLLNASQPKLVNLSSSTGVCGYDGDEVGDWGNSGGGNSGGGSSGGGSSGGGSSGGGSSGGGSSGGNEQRDTVYLSITAQTTNASQFQSPSLTNAIVEGYSYWYNGYDLSATDYVTITLPALPDEHYLYVNLAGTAVPDLDYSIFIAEGRQDVHPVNTFGNYSFYYEGNSGGSTYLYLVPKNNFYINEDKTIDVSLGELHSWNSGGTDVDVEYGVEQVSVTIVDDDQWKMFLTESAENGEAVCHDVDANDEPYPTEIFESPNDGATTAYFTLSRDDDGSHRFGDKSYSVNVWLTFDGQATTDDIRLWYNSGQTWTERAIYANMNGDNTAMVTIPVGMDEVRLRVSSVNDQVIERLRATLNISISSASNLYIDEFPVDSERIGIVVKDNDQLILNQLTFRNNLDLISDTLDCTRDTDIDTPGVMDLTSLGSTLHIDSPSFGVSWKNGPHWFKYTSHKNLPVAYACGDNLQCDAMTFGTLDPDIALQIRAKIEYGNSRFVTDWQNRSATGVQALEFTETFVEILGGRQALYDNSFTIKWEFRVVGEEAEEDVRLFADGGKSDIVLYVTYDTPKVNDLAHTIVHTGCAAANGIQLGNDTGNGNINADINYSDKLFDAIWATFESRNVPKISLINGKIKEGRALSYYGRVLPQNMTKDAVSIRNADPVPFLNSYYDIILAQNNSDDSRVQTITYARSFEHFRSSLLLTGDGKCGIWQDFAIRVYYAQGYGSVSLTQTENCFQTYNITFSENVVDSQKRFKVKDLPAQGIVTPLEFIWKDHCLIKYKNTILDPSYGLRYDFGPELNKTEEDVKKEIVLSCFDSIGVLSHNEDDIYDVSYIKTTDVVEDNIIDILSELSFLPTDVVFAPRNNEGE